MTKINVYDAKNIDEIDWCSFVEAEYVREFCFDMIKKGPHIFIENIKVELMLLQVDDYLVPITVSSGGKEQSYVVSPFTHYISYTKEELRELKNPLMEKVFAPMLTGIGSVLKLGTIDRVVTINNWMVSTNLYFSFTLQQLTDISLFLQKNYPHYAIMYRSLNFQLHRDMLNVLQKLGYLQIPSRSVYLFDPQKYEHFSKQQRKSIRQDREFLQKSGYEVVEHEQIRKSEWTRVVKLYNQLYIDKYSAYNPQFNVEFLFHAWQKRLFHFRLLKKDGRIDGVIGYFIRNGVMTTPILGYDLSIPSHEGLYRLCSILLTEYSLKEKIFLHRSAGAGEFKRNRGAKQTWEYSAVFVDHLLLKQRLAWNGLNRLIRSVGVPLMEKKNL